MKLSVLGAVMVATFGAGHAMAQEAEPYFSGPRIEARVGYDNVTIRNTVSDGVDSISRSESRNGVSYGGEIGYDHAFDRIVIGAYAGIDGSSAKQCGELYGEDRLCLRSGRSIALGGRIGAAVGSNMLVYGKGGYSNGEARVDYEDYELILPDFRESETIDGYHLGAGLEAGLPGGVYGRLEYVYTSYGESTARIEDISFSVEPYRHQAVFGLGLRF